MVAGADLMADLVYTALCSVDGYLNDAAGGFAWAAPDAQVHAFVNDLERPCGTHLYGRRTYDVMRVWDDMDDDDPIMRDFAQIWREADKIVYSRTLDSAGPRTRIARTFDADDVARLKATATQPVSIGGAHLAAGAFQAGLVDLVRLLVAPVAVGAGTPVFLLPGALELTDHRTFPSGFVFLEYRVSSDQTIHNPGD